MENSDDVKKEIVDRIEKFNEIIEMFPRCQNDLSEIKDSLETLFLNFFLPQEQKKMRKDFDEKISKLEGIKECFQGDVSIEIGLGKLKKIIKEDGLVDGSFLDFLNYFEGELIRIAKALKPELSWFIKFWNKEIVCEMYRNEEEKKRKWISVLLDKNDKYIRNLRIRLENNICLIKEEGIKKIELGEVYTAVEIFLKKQDIEKYISSSISFMSILKNDLNEKFPSPLMTDIVELKERLKSVSFGEATLEEKIKKNLNKEEEIKKSSSAVEFEKLNTEKDALDEEILSLSDFVDRTKKEISEKEEELSLLLGERNKLSAEVVEEILGKYEKIAEDISNLCDLYPILERQTVMALCEGLISRTFSDSPTLLEKWSAAGKKAIVVRFERKSSQGLIWKEWSEKDEKMMKWYLLENVPLYIKRILNFYYNEGIHVKMTIS